MPLSEDQLGPWGKRVRFAPGTDGFAYRPGEFITPDNPEVETLVRQLLDDAGEASEQRIPRLRDEALPGGYTHWTYRGDALRAVLHLRGVGVEDAQPVHVFFADQASKGDGGAGFRANPVYANPVYANPVYANPVYANPVYANPVYANPVYANPVYANPVYANPVYANAGLGIPFDAAPSVPLPFASTPLQSRAYPNPVYAERHLNPQAAARYRATGARASEARPVTGRTDDQSPDLFTPTPDWNSAPVRVLVLDTGLGAELKGKVTGGIGLSDLTDERDKDGDKYLDPVAWHGTFIAGLIRRVAPAAAVCVKQVLSSFGDGDEKAIVRALHDCVTTSGQAAPDIISLSFSGYTLDEPKAFRTALACVGAQGALVVASAGNDGIDRITYPAGFDGVIAVAALGPDGPAGFSNHGRWVNACAPGVDVVSSFLTGDFEAEGEYNYDPDDYDGRAIWSGTSFAAPIVAGAIARTLGSVPTMKPADAASVVVDQPGLWRIPGYGTVVNVLGARPDLVW